MKDINTVIKLIESYTGKKVVLKEAEEDNIVKSASSVNDTIMVLQQGLDNLELLTKDKDNLDNFNRELDSTRIKLNEFSDLINQLILGS